MEVARIGVGLGFIGLAVYGFLGFDPVPDEIYVANAALHPMGDALIFVGELRNVEEPDRLTGIASDEAARAILTRQAVVVPAGSKPVLAMDGTHGVLMGISGQPDPGRLMAVTLSFEEGGDVTTRVRIADTGMDHSRRFEVPEGAPAPSVDIDVTPDGEAWQVGIRTTNFSFSEAAVDGPHQPGEGHGHLYLNGLKLQRVFGGEAKIGALPPGTYQVRVDLNTNDHRAYSVAGERVSASAEITVE